MVAFGQIVNIAIVLGIAYVAVTYGPDWVAKAKTSFDQMQKTIQSGGGGDGGSGTVGGDTTGAPTGGLDDASLVNPPMTPSGPTAADDNGFGSTGIYNMPGDGGPPAPQLPTSTGVYSGPSNSTAHTPVDTSGLVQKHTAVPSPQNPTKGHKKKSPTTLVKQQRQQDHMQNSQTSQGHPVAPPHINVSQAHPSVGPSTTTRPATPNLGPNQRGIQSRFRPGTVAREDIDYQVGCNCAGKTCCYRGHKCDGSLGAECTTASSAAKPITDRACAALRTRFISKNPCNKPASVPSKSRFPPIRPAQWPDPSKPFKSTFVGYGIGDGGEVISLDSMFVTVA